MNDDDMEHIHDYIQWMFPTDEESMFNSDAPILNPQLQRAFGEDPQLQEELRQNLARFCTFLGLEFKNDGGKVVISIAANF